MLIKRVAQRALYCRCGRDKILAHGHCATCYSLRRQDEEHFGGLREVVLARDGYRCRVCDASGRSKRSIAVHHRVPGASLLHLMLSLCPGCHAKVHHTKAVLSVWPLLLLTLWREQHPAGHEQRVIDFYPLQLAANGKVRRKRVPLKQVYTALSLSRFRCGIACFCRGCEG